VHCKWTDLTCAQDSVCKLEGCSIANTIGTAAELRDKAEVRLSSWDRITNCYPHPSLVPPGMRTILTPRAVASAVLWVATPVKLRAQMTMIGCKFTHNSAVFSAGYPNEVFLIPALAWRLHACAPPDVHSLMHVLELK
jgi:hypothetical protein